MYNVRAKTRKSVVLSITTTKSIQYNTYITVALWEATQMLLI